MALTLTSSPREVNSIGTDLFANLCSDRTTFKCRQMFVSAQVLSFLLYHRAGGYHAADVYGRLGNTQQ